MTKETLGLIYFVGMIISSLIFGIRSYKNRQSLPADGLFTFFYTILWPIPLGVFLVRYIKYALKGKRI